MVLVDSNIIIYYLSGDEKAVEFIQQNKGKMAVSIITVMEVLSKNDDEKRLLRVERFLRKNFSWLGVNEAIILKSASVRRIKKTKSADALIVATALTYNLALVTRNLKDFCHLPVTLINPIDELIN